MITRAEHTHQTDRMFEIPALRHLKMRAKKKWRNIKLQKALKMRKQTSKLTLLREWLLFHSFFLSLFLWNKEGNKIILKNRAKWKW